MEKQARIAQNAANDKKDSNEIKMQENFLAQKFYSAYLKHKMDKEMKENLEYEKAFQKIRAATGYSDVKEIVEKFLKREETYNELLQAVSESEVKIDQLRRENEKGREDLHALQIEFSDSQSTASEKPKSSFAPELNTLDNKRVDLKKQEESALNTAKNVQLVNDQVDNWTSRVIQKLDQQFNENIGAFGSEKSMAFKFEKIKEAVCRQLEQIMMEEDDEDRGYIAVKDFMNDFGCEEFKTKNIRVRPVTDGDDETRTQGDGAISRMGLDGNLDDDEKFNEAVKFELEADRKTAKERNLKHQREKAAEEELIKKKKGGY